MFRYVSYNMCRTSSLMKPISLLVDGQRSSHYSFCATGLSLLVDALQYLRSTPQELTHLHQYMAVLILYPWTRCLFLFSFSILIILYYFISELSCFGGSHIHVNLWNLRFFYLFFFSQILLSSRSPNKQIDYFKWGAKEMQSAWWATCIKQEHCGLSGRQSHPVAFMTTVQIQAVTVLQHRNTRGYIYDLVWAVNI